MQNFILQTFMKNLARKKLYREYKERMQKNNWVFGVLTITKCTCSPITIFVWNSIFWTGSYTWSHSKICLFSLLILCSNWAIFGSRRLLTIVVTRGIQAQRRQQTWNLSKNLHDHIFGPKILHTKKCVNKDYFHFSVNASISVKYSFFVFRFISIDKTSAVSEKKSQ